MERAVAVGRRAHEIIKKKKKEGLIETVLNRSVSL